jgi:hypothetical protein
VLETDDGGGVSVASVGRVVVSVVTSVTGAGACFGGVVVLSAERSVGVLAGGCSVATGGAIVAVLAAARRWAARRAVELPAESRCVAALTGWTLSCTMTGSLACDDA